MDYWESIDSDLKTLTKDGFVKLPSISDFSWRPEVYQECLSEIGSRSYAQNLGGNLRLLEELQINQILLPRLVSIAKSEFKIEVNPDDVYNITRLVRPGDTSEGYRGHFDSHVFTLVIPINIPDFGTVKDGGQLLYFPQARRYPKSEMENIAGKVFFKQYCSKSGFEKLNKKKNGGLDRFSDYKPLLFLGRSTFHGNAPVDFISDDNRMTILVHFFDPSPKFSVGSMLRLIRSR